MIKQKGSYRYLAIRGPQVEGLRTSRHYGGDGGPSVEIISQNAEAKIPAAPVIITFFIWKYRNFLPYTGDERIHDGLAGLIPGVGRLDLL